MITTSSSVSHGFSLGQSLNETLPDGIEASTVSTQAQSVSVVIGSEPEAGDGSVGAIAQGSATAVGTDTLALGDLVATAELGGAFDSAHAEASFVAIGVDDSGGLAFASAEAYAGVLGSFDVVIATSASASTVATVGDVSTWFEAQSMSVTGIDIGGSAAAGDAQSSSDMPSGPDPDVLSDDADDLSELGASLEDMGIAGASEASGSLSSDVDLDLDITGNVAFVDFFAQAMGPDTFAEAVVAALAIEDQLSTVDGIVIAEATI
jgi:hypothetical protein